MKQLLLNCYIDEKSTCARQAFWGSSFARCPYGDVFFRRFRDIYQLFKLVRQIEATEKDTMFLLNVAQGPRHIFAEK